LRKTLKPLGVELIFPTAPREIRPADVSDPGERAKLQEIEEQGEEWQNFGWCVRDDENKDMKDLDKSIEFIGKIMETEVLPRTRGLTSRGLLWGYWGFHRALQLLLRLRRCWRRVVYRRCFRVSIILLSISLSLSADSDGIFNSMINFIRFILLVCMWLARLYASLV
jgi:hypothetical protein